MVFFFKGLRNRQGRIDMAPGSAATDDNPICFIFLQYFLCCVLNIL